MCKIKIAPSLLACDFSSMKEEIKTVESADMLHIDVMDGSFVPNITIGPAVIKSLRKNTNMTFDVHLMINNPEAHIPQFMEAGADILTIHLEATNHVNRSLNIIKDLGIKAGVAINPHTGLDNLAYILDLVDQITVMSVNPGWGGQSFIASSFEKIRHIKNIIGQRNIDISVDGGVSLENSALLAKCGATVLVAGTCVFSAKDRGEQIRKLREVL